MENAKLIASFIVGLLIGLYAYSLFLCPENVQSKTVVIEKIKTDTVWMVQEDTIFLERIKIKHEYLRDTVLLPDWRPQINQFSARFPVAYGNVYFSGEVLGEVLKTSMTTNLNIPVVTNTIDRTTTKTIIQKPKGIYGTVGSNTDLNISIGATYLNDKSLIGYEYQPQIKLHSVRVGWKIF